MGYFNFVWDEEKYDINLQKHNITFEEASTVFEDDDMIYKMDVKHSRNEVRYKIIGMSDNPRLLVVCHCIRNGNTIRIISARKANKTEAQEYVWRQLNG